MTLRSTAVALGLALGAVGGCGRSRPPPAQAGLSPKPVRPADSYGAATMADIENARFAISRGDVVAAENDILDATGLAQRLDKQPPFLFLPNAAPNGARGQPTRFGVQAGLVQARTALVMGDLASCDRQLSALLQRIPANLVPAQMPLVRARATLRLAKTAAATGGLKELRTRLEGAREAVAEYAGPGAGEAQQKVEQAIGSYLSPGGLERLSAPRAQLLAGQVDGLIEQAEGRRPT